MRHCKRYIIVDKESWVAAVYSLSNDVVRGHVIIIDTVIIDSQFIYDIKKKLVK